MKPLTMILAAGLLLLAGCATPAARIRRNPAVFDRATPEQQGLIKKGRVGIGFTPQLVELALGKPDRVWERTDRTGKSTIWSYVAYESPDGVLVYRNWCNPWWGPGYPVYTELDNGYEHARVRVRIVFRHDKVVSVEREMK